MTSSAMSCTLIFNPFLGKPSIRESRKPPEVLACSHPTVRIVCSSSGPHHSVTTEISGNNASLTGGAYDFENATTSLSQKSLSSPKKVTLVRHGLSSWNIEGRVQGSSNLSVLTESGIAQAERCRTALADMHFDRCFSSPISRAKCLEAEDAKRIYPKEFTQWREDPSNFSVNGVYPLKEVWKQAREAWLQILFTPGENFVVVTHKSILRALICTALGLGPERFRAIDINNGGLSVFSFNKNGEAMLKSLNRLHICTLIIFTITENYIRLKRCGIMQTRELG